MRPEMGIEHLQTVSCQDQAIVDATQQYAVSLPCDARMLERRLCVRSIEHLSAQSQLP